jgi:hypothetical protein
MPGTTKPQMRWCGYDLILICSKEIMSDGTSGTTKTCCPRFTACSLAFAITHPRCKANPCHVLRHVFCRDAIELLLESNVSGAPVVNQDGVLVGMLSESDLLWKVSS